ncbi:hypothetical protein CEXT_424011 [Caerostris extrusa]|uniref:Uncharacterized protein n=1 Tax=Caerostris extrusa TaxID=172846 RepID=A0AAV4N5M5_CAEEX|nr:hypothetical protein CEXT_424011 [Caerostris extrusa]
MGKKSEQWLPVSAKRLVLQLNRGVWGRGIVHQRRFVFRGAPWLRSSHIVWQLRGGPSTHPPLIIYHIAPESPALTNSDLTDQTEADQTKNTPAPLLNDTSDEYILVNQVLLRKASHYKTRLTQTATKIAKLKIDDPATSQLHTEMADLYKLTDGIKYEFGMSLFKYHL